MMNNHLNDFIRSSRTLAINAQLEAISFAEFWQDVAVQAVWIQKSPQSIWALWEQDSYDFLVLLFAGLVAKKRILLPPNRVTQLEQDFRKQDIHFLSRQFGISPIQMMPIPEWNNETLNQAHIDFYTSGSTGQPKRIERNLAQLLSEVQGLDQTFPLAENSIALATVSHQHIYGLLFKVLWPLVTGRCFYSPQLGFPEDVVIMQQRFAASNRQNYVISSPALLKRWNKDMVLKACEAVFSSGGKLESGIRPQLNYAVTEILGSSETGGIAYRHQDYAAWQAFADVNIQIEQAHLQVKTAHAYTEQWIETGDLARWQQSDNTTLGFELLGRADRLIKLEEKRLSLDAIEQVIQSQFQVEQCHALVVEHQQRQLLACIVVLNADARASLKLLGKRQFVSQLKHQLSHALERIAIPRLWRFLTDIPHNSQSKRDKHYLKSLFQPMLYPVVLQRIALETEHCWTLEFSPELECFRGHFPTQPIYPGVGQIGFVDAFAKQIWADLDWCSGYEQLKFQHVILPYSVIAMKLTRKQHKISFELRQQDQTMASGRLLFALKCKGEESST